MTLTARLLLGFLIIAAGAFYLFRDQLLKRVERQYLEAVEEPMVDVAQILASSLEDDVHDGQLDVENFSTAFIAAKNRRFEAKIYSLRKQHINTEVYVTDSSGRVLFDSAQPENVGLSYLDNRDVRLSLQGVYGARSTRLNDNDDDSSVMYVGAPVRANEKIVGVVSVSKPQRAVFQFRDETRSWLTWRISTILVCMVLASFLLARWATAPVERLTEHARAITRGERPHLPKLAGRDLKTLGEAFEKMRDELEGREYVEGYVQTLTHELKSPVSAIRGAAELLAEKPPAERQDKFLSNIQKEALRLQDLIDRLLELTALEKTKTLKKQDRVRLQDIVASLEDHFSPVLCRRKVDLQCNLAPGSELVGDPFLVELALMNVLQNALDFSPDGGVIRLWTEKSEGLLKCIVEDEGPGLPDYARDRVFERFYSLPRPNGGHKSSGLGLCFVREIASLHGGAVSIQNREGCKGARLELGFPV